MMDIDESKCCPQAVRSELEFQEYLIQFIQQFCYLGLGRDHILVYNMFCLFIGKLDCIPIKRNEASDSI